MAKGKARRRRRKNQNEVSPPTTPPPPPPQEEIGGGREIMALSVIMDTDLLNCSICAEFLHAPLHQCKNGHVVCPECWPEVQHKCHMCTLPLPEGSRNTALENFLDSVQIPCTYANLGCQRSVFYPFWQLHISRCEFGPSSCRIPGCAHKALSEGELQGHILKDHWDLVQLGQQFTQQEQQFTQQEQQFTQEEQWLIPIAQLVRYSYLESGKMPEQLRSELQNMSIASTEWRRRLREMSIAMHRFSGDNWVPPPEEEIGGGRVIIDTNLLDCSICTNPLCPPLHQCTSGHVACHSCWSILQDKCHICMSPVLSRNIALEKVLESVHLSCTYSNLGCNKSVSYSQRQVHADTCEYGQSSCPIPGCAHKAFSGEWREHFVKVHWVHWDNGSNYSHGRSIYMVFKEKDLEKDLYFTLLGPDKDLFLFVNEPILNVGNIVSLYYIDLPHQKHNAFSCELTVYGRYNTNTMQLKLPAISIKKWKKSEVGPSSLLVPLGFPAFQNAYQWMKVQVLINKELDK